MKRIWQVVNTVVVADGAAVGYKATSLEHFSRANANPDAFLCGIVLILFAAFVLGFVYYSKLRWDRDNKILARPFKLRRPSWSRNPANWWDDPLQPPFIAMCFSAAMAIGASFRRPAIGSVGFWAFALYCCSALGLFIGQFLAFRVFRKHIAIA